MASALTPLDLALAGLLHDIGKFAHRAGEEYRGGWSDPATRADFRYAHAYLTHRVLQELLPRAWRGTVGPLAAYHHAPKNPAQARIRLADQLSAGERASGDARRDDADPAQHPRQLHPIFTRIILDGEKHLQPKQVLALAPLRLRREVLFPHPQALDAAATRQAYEALWALFTREAAALRNAAEQGALDQATYLEAMQALFMRTAWCVPAAYFKTVPDVSLYDHSRMTAALAVALADFDDAEVQALAQAWQAQAGPRWETPVALLVGGDLSGVQKFIYTIAAKGAAKMLRGRSFYLQLLTEAVLRFLLRELSLPYSQVIYTGGGAFFLLAPRAAEARLPDLQRRIGERLYAYHGLDLGLVLGWTPVHLREFQPGAFPEAWGRMHRALQQRKTRRLADWRAEALQRVFAVSEHGGDPKAMCVVCGAEDRTVGPWDEDGREDRERICTFCRSFADDLGRDLARAGAVAWRWVPPGKADPRQATFADVLAAFGAQVRLVPEDAWAAVAGVAEEGFTTLWLLDDPPANWSWPPLPAWLRYSVTQIPWVRDDAEAEAINRRLSVAEQKEQAARKRAPKTFTHLQVQTVGGFHRLGVLRMDVDDLGRLFREGLGRQATLSRLAALSFQMSLFFEGWLERIIAGKDPLTGEPAGLKYLIYAVYAGGDDLFLVGPWDRMPHLAQCIAADFAAYTGHPALHLSGGLAFIHGKYPIYQAALDAGDAEEAAKALPGKNAFTFLGRPWKWDVFQELERKKGALLSLVQQEGETGPRSILRVVQNLARLAEKHPPAQGAASDRPLWGRWMWWAAYQLSRMAGQAEKLGDASRAQAYRDLLDDWEASGFRNLVAWGTAARWAELLVRQSSR